MTTKSLKTYLIILTSVFSITFLPEDSFIPFKSSRRIVSIPPITFTGSKLYGPYKGGETVTFSWEYKNTSLSNYSSLSDYFIVTCPSYSSTPLLSKRVDKHASKAGQVHSISYSYTIPSKRINTDSGLVIKVGVQSGGSYIGMLEKKLKPALSNNINPLNYRSTPYVIEDRIIKFSEEKVVESFLFDEYQDYVECDPYYRLLFEKLSFLYNYPENLTYSSVKIKFLDTYNLYPYIKRDGDGYTYVSGVFEIEDNRVSLATSNVWVDPVSLRCDDHGMGRMKSRYLYAPKGKGHLLSGYEFVIEANGLGVNKTSFTHCLEVSVSSYFIGDCDSADFCIVGGIKE